MTFSQQTLPLTGLSFPYGVAVDGFGDVFVADTSNSRVLELPAGSSKPQTLPYTGLYGPFGVAVDGAGNVFVAEYSPSAVVELSPSVPVGSFVVSPASGPATRRLVSPR